MKNIVVLVSGGGTNLQALIAAVKPRAGRLRKYGKKRKRRKYKGNYNLFVFFHFTLLMNGINLWFNEE